MEVELFVFLDIFFECCWLPISERQLLGCHVRRILISMFFFRSTLLGDRGVFADDVDVRDEV